MISISEMLLDIDSQIMKNFLINPKNRAKYDANFIEEINKKEIFPNAFKSQYVELFFIQI